MLDLDNAWEVWNWSHIFKCGEDELRAAAATVGLAIANLKSHFGK